MVSLVGQEDGTPRPAERGSTIAFSGPAASRMRMTTRSRTALTDTAGRFQFSGVAAGLYRLVAMAGPNSGRYLSGGYGAGRPNEAGRPFVVIAGQEIKDADIGLITASAIEGRVLDEAGEPVARASVNAARVVLGSSVPQRVSALSAHTDDLGRFRIYGLEPGTYVVVAEGMRVHGSSVEGDALGFLTTYHPASPTDAAAQRVRVLPSQDVSGIDIQLVRSRRYSVTGALLGSDGQPLLSPSAALIRPTLGGQSSSHVRIDGEGRFSARELDPGEYRLEVQGSSQSSGTVRTEFAAVALTVNSDIDDVLVVAQPGVTLGGQIVFANGVAPETVSLTVSLHAVMMPASSSRFERHSQAAAHGRFTFEDVFGPKLLRLASLPENWALQAVVLGGVDVTDVPTVFRPDHDGRLQMIVTTRAGAIEGRVTGERGEDGTDATVYVFPEERVSWQHSSPRVRTSEVGDGGRFVVRGLPAGRYLAAAVAREGFRAPANAGEEFFAVLSTQATAFVIGDDEKRTLDLPVWRWPE
jgi:hypothetical protein